MFSDSLSIQVGKSQNALEDHFTAMSGCRLVMGQGPTIQSFTKLNWSSQLHKLLPEREGWQKSCTSIKQLLQVSALILFQILLGLRWKIYNSCFLHFPVVQPGIFKWCRSPCKRALAGEHPMIHHDSVSKRTSFLCSCSSVVTGSSIPTSTFLISQTNHYTWVR